MALITKDGKDDKATHDYFETLDGIDPEYLLPEHVQESRGFVQVTLEGVEDLSVEERRKCEGYWKQASLYGLVDSIIRPPSREIHVVLAVTDREEAEELVQNAPMVSDGKVSPRWGGEMPWL